MTEYQGEKFKEYLKINNISTEKAAQKLNKSKQTVYQYFNSKNLSREVVSNILNTFKVDESDIWDKAKFTKGVRLEAIPFRLTDPEGHEATDKKFYELADGSLIMQVPIISQKAYAGYLRGWADPEFYEDLLTLPLPVERLHKGTYMGFEVVGNSMVCLDTEELAERSIFPGRIAIGRELAKHQWRYKLHTHNFDTWIIVHRTEGILIKEIIRQDVDNGIITIHSLNSEYEDQDLHLDDIEQIFNVVQIIKKK